MAKEMVGYRVRARTKDGPVTGMVREVISRQDAERMLGIRKPDRLPAGRYLVVRGVPYPVRRARCKLVSE